MASYESNLKEVQKELQKKQERALESSSQFVLGEVSHRAPVDTGNLKGSYHREIDRTKHVVYIGTNVYYAPFQEFGTGIYAESGKGRKTPWVYMDDHGNWRITRGSRANPHLRPSFRENKERIQKLIRQEMGR